MKAFLLAAGRGTRISKYIPNIPKCTVDVDGEPMIRRTVDMLINNHIETTIIVGYKHQEIEKVLAGYPVHIVYNPFFDVTNSIGSLWMAKELFSEKEDTIVANGDVFWSQEILDMIRKVDEEVFLLADSERADDGDYFFGTENGMLRRYGKELSREERDCEYMGIACLKPPFIQKFLDRLNQLVDSQDHGKWWEDVIYSYVKEMDIPVVNVAGHFWAEVDFIEDYQRILDYVEKNKEK